LICDLLKLKQLAPCPPCPADPWVVLAKVTLPVSPADKIADAGIDNFTFRRQLFSTALLQEQLIDCCCGPETKEPARVTSVNPPNDAEFFLIEGQPAPPNFPRDITIVFDKKLQAATVTASSIQVSVSKGGGAASSVAGDVTYDDATRTARFKPQEGFPGSVNGNRYSLTVRGDGPNPVTDIDDLAIDGNADGSAGGNFESQFSVVFVVA